MDDKEWVILTITPMAFPFRITPLNNITPFTYRDGTSHAQLVEGIRHYLESQLPGDFNAAIEQIFVEFNAGLANTEAFATGKADATAALLTKLLADVTALLTANLANPCPLPGGGTNDEVALNAWFAANAGKEVALWPLTYRTSDQLNISPLKGLNGNGAVIDGRTTPAATALAQRYGMKAAGSLGTEIPLTTAIPIGQTTIDGIAAGTFAPGDVVLLANTDVPVTGLTRANRYTGELNTVQRVDGNLITLETGALFAYSTNGLSIRKVNVIDNLYVRNLTIRMNGVGYAHNAFEVQYGRNIVTENVTGTNAEDVAISYRTVLGGTINNPIARDSTSSASYGSSGYGVALVDGTRDVTVNNGQFDRNRHHVAGGGVWPAVHNTINSCHGRYSSSYGFDTHESCFWWTFNHVEAHHASHGFFTRGQSNTFNHCKSFDSAQESFSVHAFDGVGNQDAISFNDCEGHRGRYGLSATNVTRLRAKGFRFFDCGTNPVRVTGFDGLDIDGLEIYGSVGHALRLEGTDAVHSKNAKIANLTINGAELNAVDIRYVDGVQISNASTDSPGNYPYYLQDCTDTILSNVRGKAGGYGGVYLWRGQRHSVIAGNLSGSTNMTYADGVRAHETNHVKIIGGDYSQARWGVYTTETDNVIVMGADLSGSGSKLKIDNYIAGGVVTKVVQGCIPLSVNI
jgi:hypothetical protein